MKRLRIAGKLVLIMLIFTGLAWAQQKKERRRPPPETAFGVKSKDVLKSQEWVIYLRPFKDDKAKPQVDILTFSENNKLSSKNLFGKGYKEAEYSLVISPEGITTWEAAQEGTEGALAFWRGELNGKTIQGILSLLSQDGILEDLYFTNLAPDEKK